MNGSIVTARTNRKDNRLNSNSQIHYSVDVKHSSKRTIVLHSGGLDSSVCLLLAHRKGREVLSLGVDYDQRHRVEMRYASELSRKHGIPRRVVKVRWDKPPRPIPKNRTVEEIRESVSSAFLPGRNVLFLAIATAESADFHAEEVWIGVNSVDYSGYPDCRKEFIVSFQSMLEKALLIAPRIVAPLQDMSKPHIARLAIKLKLSREETWSCYTPVRAGKNLHPCGKCDGCILSSYAWENADKARLPDLGI